MTKKGIILDALINDSEAITQIKEYFDLLCVEVSLVELNVMLEDLCEKQLIYIDECWVNELGEKPYTITEKGKKELEKSKSNIF